MLATVLNAVLQDLRDRHFIAMAKRKLESNHPDILQDPDVKLAITFLDELVLHDIDEQKEALYMINSLEFSEDVKGNLDETRYSKKFKKDLLTNLDTNGVVSNLQPTIDRIVEGLSKVKMSHGKKSADALNGIYDDIEELHQTSFKSKVSTTSGKYLIFDPIIRDSQGTISNVYEEVLNSVTNQIKTFPALDQFFGGGIRPSSAVIFAARPANFKSGMLHNIALYASKNNTVSSFDLKPGLKPCIVFFSLELYSRQMFQRHLEWCGIHLSDEDVRKMSEKDLIAMVSESYQKVGLNIPIIYVVRIQGEYSTNVEDIAAECRTIENTYGYQAVMCLIDYIDRMQVLSKEHRKYSGVGAEGSAVLRQKVAECRNLAGQLKAPVVTAAQLNGEAELVIGQYAPYFRQLDLLHAFHQGMLAGSKILSSELEALIFLHKVTIENRSQDGEIRESRSYIAARLVKDRDNLAQYVFSKRDMAQDAAYRRYTTQIKNSPLRELLKITSDAHTVIPLDHYRLSDEDYAYSIRCFYPSEKSDFIGLQDLIHQQGGGYGNLDDAFQSI